MALPKEPRQKMINLMYLVLTALLALNVSAEILNAFKTVDRSLTTTNSTINHSTETILGSLEDKTHDPTSAAKANIWLPKAQKAAELTKAMYAYIQDIKGTIMKEAGFNPNKENKFDSSFKQDNLDIATRILVEGGKGKELHDRLAKYKADLLGIDPEIAKTFANSLQIDLSTPPVQDKGNKTWEAAYFHMVPTIATITMLSKFQNDVKTSENKVVAYCHEQVGKVTVRYDRFNAIVGQSSNYVMPGQEIEIMAGVGAFRKAATPQISINGQGAALGEDGAAHVKLAGGGLGAHTVPVHIVYKDQDGNPQIIDKTVSYTVGEASASIALDKMNVLYIGVDNPITVAASGAGDDKVQPVITGGGGSVTKVGKGKYIAHVTSVTDNCIITVTAEGKALGASTFRVRTVPTPVASVGQFASGENVSAGAFKAMPGVSAYIKDFPFELKYSVASYSISADNDDGDIVTAECQGYAWSSKAQSIISTLKPGRTVTVDGIYAIGPDGRRTHLPSLVYYIK
jgi:gliding motility-associated protein GldM